MTRKLFLLATVLFWLAVLAAWAGSRWWPAPPTEPVLAAEKRFTPAEVARHASADDCWMAIGEQVYDLTSYLPEHPTRPAIIVPWCGKEASEAYRTKNKGRPHSPEADQLLAAYRIGRLAAE